MKAVTPLLASAALVAMLGANAQVVGSTVSPDPGPFLTLTAAGLAPSGSFAGAALVGGTVFGSDQAFADMPKGAGAATVGNFLAAGPTAGSDADAGVGRRRGRRRRKRASMGHLLATIPAVGADRGRGCGPWTMPG